MKINKLHKQHPRKVFLITLGIVSSALVLYGLVAYSTSGWPFGDSEKTRVENNDTEKTDEINYNPPTEQEIEDSQDGKHNIIDSSKDTTKPSAVTKKNISVGISFANITQDRKDRLEIRAFTPGVVEGNGTCTATLRRGAHVVSESSLAFIDSSSSQCRPIYIPVIKFSEDGLWSLVVSYDSPESTGSSEVVEVEI